MASGFNSLHAGYFLCSLSSADFTWSGSKLFTYIISRRHLYMYIKSVVRRPYQLAPRTVKITFMVWTNSRRFDTGVTSQELLKIVGIVSSISLLENGTEQTLGAPRVRTRWIKYFRILVNLLALHCLITHSRKAITVHKEGGGGYSDTVWYMRRLGAFFLFKFMNYVIFFFYFFFFFLGGGGGGGWVRNINIFGGMKILWIFLGGHDKIGLVLGVSSMYFRVFS